MTTHIPKVAIQEDFDRGAAICTSSGNSPNLALIQGFNNGQRYVARGSTFTSGKIRDRDHRRHRGDLDRHPSRRRRRGCHRHGCRLPHEDEPC